MKICKVILTDKYRNCNSPVKDGSEYCVRHSKLWDKGKHSLNLKSGKGEHSHNQENQQKGEPTHSQNLNNTTERDGRS